MELSSELVSQFVKATTVEEKPISEETVYGKIVEYNGSKYVQLDGSDLLTPISSTADAQPGERVTVMIKNHTATVTGNISSPSARTGDVQDIADQIIEVEILVADKVSTSELEVERGRIDDLLSDNVTIKNRLTASEADIDTLQTDNVTINEKLTAAEADIDNLETTKLDASVADITYATITDLEATNADIYNLESTYGEFKSLTTNKFTAIDASISDLETNKLSTESAEITYANIDFSNIGKAAIEEFYSKSGLIENLVVGEGTITGKLVGVTISGDSIEANTIKADKLLVLGSDGLYYKLNVNALGEATASSDKKYQNGLDGTAIIAKSITATQIRVSDLVAFDATIGGFNITDSSIYSGAKNSVDNTTSGIFLDNTGQMNIGDSENFFKYYKDSEGNYKLEISANSIILGTSSKNVETSLDDIQTGIDKTNEDISNIEQNTNDLITRIETLEGSIVTLVKDKNGNVTSMTQTGTGWEFNISQLNTDLNTISNDVESLDTEIQNTNGLLDALNGNVENHEEKLSCFRIGTDENDEPYIEIGYENSTFKLRLMDNQIRFMEGSEIPTYISNQTMNIKSAEIENELKFGGFSWINHDGSMGLIWKGDEA